MPIAIYLSLEGATLRYEIEENVVTLRASEAVAQCIVIGPVCGFVCVCGFALTCVCLCVCVCVCFGCVCGSVATITRNGVHRSSPNWVCR